MNLEKHLDSISAVIATLKKADIQKFLAWSLFPLEKEQGISDFIDSTGASKLRHEVHAFLEACWNQSVDKSKTQAVYELLISHEWDDDHFSTEQEELSQGAVDFLGGAECLAKYVKTGNKKFAIDCSAQIFSRIEYKIDFSNSEAHIKKLQSIEKREVSNQLQFLKSELESSDRSVLHTELLAFLEQQGVESKAFVRRPTRMALEALCP